MGIRHEMTALRARLHEERQRELDLMGEIARVFLDIDDVRERGFARLAHVFGQSVETRPPEPIAQAATPRPYEVQEGRVSYHQGSVPDVSIPETDPDAYSKAVAEAYGQPDHYAADLEGAQHMAERFSSWRGAR
jgi:hypothetical protein